MTNLVRLNKHLADLGIASRRESDELIAQGMVRVNGKIATVGTKVSPGVDKVEVSRREIAAFKKLIYVALHKPLGYVSAAQKTTQDPKIVLDLVPVQERIYPVGRLDKDSTGLILLTNDGTLTFKLTHPSSECEKEYEVEVEGGITNEAIHRLEQGVSLWGHKTRPTQVRRLGPNRFRIILKEGKNRQIRRMCEKVGHPVTTLKRVRIKNLMLGTLKVGAWRFLTPEEVRDLKS